MDISLPEPFASAMEEQSFASVVILERLATYRSITGRDQSAAVWPLAFHPDPARRNPRRVIAIQNSWVHEEPATEGVENHSQSPLDISSCCREAEDPARFQ